MDDQQLRSIETQQRDFESTERVSRNLKPDVTDQERRSVAPTVHVAEQINSKPTPTPRKASVTEQQPFGRSHLTTNNDLSERDDPTNARSLQPDPILTNPVEDPLPSPGRPKIEILYYVISQGIREYWRKGSLQKKRLDDLFSEISELTSRIDVTSILFTLSTSEPLRYRITREDTRVFEVMKTDFGRGIRQDAKMGISSFEIRLEVNPGEAWSVILEEDLGSDVGL